MKKLLLLVAVAMSLPAAATNMKPGLWEMTTESAAMQNMPKLSAQQLEQMKKMGVDIAQLQGGAIINKVCITREMAERTNATQGMPEQTGCKPVNQTQSGSTYTVDLVCDGKDMKGKGRSKAVFSGDRSFVTESEFKGTMHGMPVNDRSKISGKWLANDCGSVKPIAPPQR